MKLSLLFGFLLACSGADPGLLDAPPASTTQSASDDDASTAPDAAVLVLPLEASTCTGYAEPSANATCHACSGSTCQTNGCFGGYWCNLDTSHCVPKPEGCP